MEDVNMVPPQEAHLIIGKVQTHFFSVPEEHDLTKRFLNKECKSGRNTLPHTCVLPLKKYNL
jgi:hypothetical protein